MKYFQPFFKNDSINQTNQNIDITVHCDVKIFEWLIKYMQYKEYLDSELINKTQIN